MEKAGLTFRRGSPILRGMTVYGYLRVSGKGQVDGDGPERQREAIKNFVERHGLALAGEGFDGGISGTVEGMERPEFSRLMDLCKDGAGIVVEKLDRLARDLMVQELLLARCRKEGVPIFATEPGELVDLASCDGDPSRTMIRQIIGAVAQYDKSSLVAKLRVARQRVKARTGRCEGRKPFGFREDEKGTLADMLAYYEASGSYSATARWLNDMGSSPRRGATWNRGTVWEIVRRHGYDVELFELDSPTNGGGAGGDGTAARDCVERRKEAKRAMDERRAKRRAEQAARHAERAAREPHADSVRDMIRLIDTRQF